MIPELDSVRYTADANDFQIAPHFNVREVECPCCKKVIIVPRLFNALETTRERIARPMLLTSGVRCRRYQVWLYKKINERRLALGLPPLRIPKVGYHVTAEAIDTVSIVVPGEKNSEEEHEYVRQLRDDGWVGIGIQKKVVVKGKVVDPGWTHLDTRLTAPALWYYSGGR